jgi:crotonobetainyl-CoA:carnitine CoA-transferase CaiB-like acyl-CoA transferase
MSVERPLTGVRVADFSRILAGPYFGLLLQDMGAEVIKVERADRGDDTRGWSPTLQGAPGEERISTYFAAVNRGKQSVAIDFRRPGARELTQRLAAACDIVVENFRPGVAADMGIDYAGLSPLNPTVVCCSISGYGNAGELSQLPGTEIVVEAMSGLMAVTGPADGEPVRFGVALVDITTGLTGAVRTLGALLHARATGVGGQVDVSLYGTALGVLGTLVADATRTGVEPTRWGSHHPSLVPYGGYPTADGNLITGVLNDAMWLPLCEALEMPELAARDEWREMRARVRDRGEVEPLIAAATRRNTTAYWVGRLNERGLLGAPIRAVGEAVRDPATAATGLLVGLEGHDGVLATRLDSVGRPGSTEQVPRLGEHTRPVLERVLGLGPADLDALAAQGIIAG